LIAGDIDAAIFRSSSATNCSDGLYGRRECALERAAGGAISKSVPG
jgi:hypothetical protein